MLTRGFESRISWILWGHRNHSVECMRFVFIKGNFNKGSRFRIILAGIYSFGSYTSTKTLVVHPGSNTGRIGLVSAVLGYIPNFGQKMKIGW